MVLFEGRDASAVREEDVEEPVVVEIEESDAAKRRVDQRFVGRRAVVQDEIDVRSRLPVSNRIWRPEIEDAGDAF